MSTRGFVSIGTPDRFRAPLQSFRFLSAPPIGGAFTPWIARFSRLNTPLEQATQRMIHQEFACEAERPGSRDGHHAASMASWQRNGPVRNALRPRRADRPRVT